MRHFWILACLSIAFVSCQKKWEQKYVEEAKKRLAANSNYDMTIDNLLMKMWEEINEKYSRR